MTRGIPGHSRRRAGLALALAALLATLVACGQLDAGVGSDQAAEAARAAVDTQHYLVVARGGARAAHVTAAIEAAGGSVTRALPSVGVFAAASTRPDFAGAVLAARVIEAADPMPLMTLPDVVLHESSVRDLGAVAPAAVPEPPAAFWDELWGIARVHAPAAWERGVTGSLDTVVAVIDTGIAWNHPDLADRIVHTACFAVTIDPCIDYPWLSFHGTHVAGTVAANFGGGVVGVGPELGLASYNVFELFEVEPGEFAVQASFDSIFAAMIDAADEGFDVINMSLGALVVRGGGPASRDAAAIVTATKRVADYVRRAGTLVVASAGNAALDLTGPLLNLPGGPPGVVNVAATGIRPDPVYPQPGAYDVLAFYSNYGAPVDIAAPGGDCGLDDSCDPAERPANWFEYLVLSTYVAPDLGCAQTASCPVGWAFAAGTSMAAPHVSGVAGLVRDEHPRLRPNQVSARLQRTAESIGHRLTFGSGMVDADRATR
jgi:lantibiotic leader peptide-processing serine protease